MQGRQMMKVVYDEDGKHDVSPVTYQKRLRVCVQSCQGLTISELYKVKQKKTLFVTLGLCLSRGLVTQLII